MPTTPGQAVAKLLAKALAFTEESVLAASARAQARRAHGPASSPDVQRARADFEQE